MSPGKTEDVLYDYHLTQALINQMSEDDRQKKADYYIESVFHKHNITQEVFDSTLIYYNAHAEQLQKIYSNVNERLENRNHELQLITGNTEMSASIETGADTTNIWNKSKLIALRNNEFQNLSSFTIKADTSYYPNDKYILFSNINKISSSTSRSNVTICLTIVNKLNKTISHVIQTELSGPIQIEVQQGTPEEIKYIYGYFYLNGEEEKAICIINNIQLIRMHKQPIIVEPEETDVADSIIVDTTILSDRHSEKRLTPEELRLKTTSDEERRIIRKAPEKKITPQRRRVYRR